MIAGTRFCPVSAARARGIVAGRAKRIPKSESLVTTEKFKPERAYGFKLSQICPGAILLIYAH